MTLERLLIDLPQLHAWSDGRPASWAVAPEVLRFMHSLLRPGMQTLETGSGHTTVLFAIAGTDHTCITPSGEEARRVAQYCERIGVAPRIRFVERPSDEALPAAGVVPPRLDFVFIDGAHRFPLPCIDFHYTEAKLVVGGVLGLDDCTMPSVRVLHDFLCGEAEWRKTRQLGNTAFFERIRETRIVSDWQGQKINDAYRGGASKRHPLRRLAQWARGR